MTIWTDGRLWRWTCPECWHLVVQRTEAQAVKVRALHSAIHGRRS